MRHEKRKHSIKRKFYSSEKIFLSTLEKKKEMHKNFVGLVVLNPGLD